MAMVVNIYRMLNPITDVEQNYMPIAEATEVRLGLDLDPEYGLKGKVNGVSWYRATPYNVTELEKNGIKLRDTVQFIHK